MEVWVPILFIAVPLAIVAAVVYALVRIRKRRKKDNAQASRAEDEVDPRGKSFLKAASKRYAGLTGWAWLLAGFAIYEVWTEVSALKSGEGSFFATYIAMAFAAAAAIYVFIDWLKPRRLSRVWRVLSVTGVALVCSVVAISLALPMIHWGSCVSGDCQSGHGTFNYVTGHTYEGEWRNGEQGPQGAIRYANGKTYIGEWRDSAPRGQGTTTWPNGDVYVGEHWVRPWGTGTKTYADGRVESGQWVFGRLVEPDVGDAEAAVWFLRKAAEHGDADAQYSLGFAYLRGTGVERNSAEAAHWWRTSAEQGDADAQYAYGYLYSRGEGVSLNLDDAVMWYQKAASQGYSWAEYALGSHYMLGLGVERDRAEATKWFQLVAGEDDYAAVAESFARQAENGEDDAQFFLGMTYHHGHGVPQDDAKALEWFQKAADQGYVVAQLTLGQMN